MKDIILNNWDKLIWIIAFFYWIWQFFKTQKQSLEIERLKNQLELEKTQKLLNDEKFRKGYEEFIALLFSILNKDRKLDKTEQWIINFMKTSILFAWPETLKSFWWYRREAGTSNQKKIAFFIEELLFNMRKDLWVSNYWLKQYDILQTLIVGDAKKELSEP